LRRTLPVECRVWTAPGQLGRASHGGTCQIVIRCAPRSEGERMSDESEGRSRQEAAAARGKSIRSALTEMLTPDGPQTASALLPRIETPDISLSEVAFQLQRLCQEG